MHQSSQIYFLLHQLRFGIYLVTTNGGRNVKKFLLGLFLSLPCAYSLAQIDEVRILDSLKSEACHGDKICKSKFISAISMTSNISRYHGECLSDGDTSKKCKSAKITYEHIASEYERDKKSRE